MLFVINGDEARFAINVFHISALSFSEDYLVISTLDGRTYKLRNKTQADFISYLEQIKALKVEAFKQPRPF